MSELISRQPDQSSFRWRLLASASAIALLASAYVSGAARAEDADRPTLWIELGGQLERLSESNEKFSPPFVANIPDTLFSPLGVQKPLNSSFAGEGSLAFQPEGSDWALAASIRFGRSNGVKHKTQLIKNAYVPVHITAPKYVGGYSYYPSGHAKFEDVKTQQRETHTVLDFQAGKDVGLGLFGNRGSSVLSAGVRFAQFTSHTTTNMRVEPDVQYPSTPITTLGQRSAWRDFRPHFHDYQGLLDAERSFHGWGPSIAWNGSMSFLGNQDAGEMALDWGANAAILFGRQKVHGQHQTTTRTYDGPGIGFERAANTQSYDLKPGNFMAFNEIGQFTAPAGLSHQIANNVPMNRTRWAAVPNLGGFAGLSFRYSDAKVSFGYRADFFFGAMDDGIDTRKSEDIGFHGPFATISIGLGG